MSGPRACPRPAGPPGGLLCKNEPKNCFRMIENVRKRAQNEPRRTRVPCVTNETSLVESAVHL
jgi:hypothetical protein